MLSDRLRVSHWADADPLFHADPCWRGGDDAYSVELAPGRNLWLFGDSFIDPRGEARRGSTMIHNSVAIQSGSDPRASRMSFYWDDSGARPRSFFPMDTDIISWPLDACLVDGKLLLFFVTIQLTRGRGAFPFRSLGTRALLVSNPGDAPPAWDTREVFASVHGRHAIDRASSVLVQGEHLYLFGYSQPRQIGLARIPIEKASRGVLDQHEVWAGRARGWVHEARLGGPAAPVFGDGRNEFSVRWVPRLQAYLEVQGIGRWGRAMAVRTSPKLEGPWSALRPVHAPEEVGRDNTYLYAYKAHSELPGADVVVTYASNSRDSRSFHDESIYWPRFLAISITD